EEPDAGRRGPALERAVETCAELAGVRVPAGRARDRVVGDREGELRVPHRELAAVKLPPRGRPRQGGQQVAGDGEQRPAVAELAHHVRVPELVEERGGHHSDGSAKRRRSAFHSSAPKRRKVSATLALGAATGGAPVSRSARSARSPADITAPSRSPG